MLILYASSASIDRRSPAHLPQKCCSIKLQSTVCPLEGFARAKANQDNQTALQILRVSTAHITRQNSALRPTLQRKAFPSVIAFTLNHGLFPRIDSVCPFKCASQSSRHFAADVLRRNGNLHAIDASPMCRASAASLPRSDRRQSRFHRMPTRLRPPIVWMRPPLGKSRPTAQTPLPCSAKPDDQRQPAIITSKTHRSSDVMSSWVWPAPCLACRTPAALSHSGSSRSWTANVDGRG